jgi:DNA polymerase III delta prime subunit
MIPAAIRLLETARRNELHHAMILHGPQHSFLSALAVRVAKTLNCLEGSTGDACASCQRIDRRSHPDVHYLEVAGDRKMISIDQIRELLESASLRPYEGRNKVFIIDPADALSISGSNSLLKTLEEPTRDTTFILLTRSPDLLLPTIRSRSQSIHVGADEARQLTGPRQAIRAAQFLVSETEGDAQRLTVQIVDLLHRFAERREGSALLALAALLSSQDNVNDSLALFASVLTDVVGLDARESVDPEKLQALRRALPQERLLAAADAALAGIRGLAVNADARLVAEQAVAVLAIRG